MEPIRQRSSIYRNTNSMNLITLNTMEDLLGDQPLKSKQGNIDTKIVLRNDIYCLFIASSRDSHCTEFNKKLVSCYDNWKKTKRSIEVIFVPRDLSEIGSNDFFKTMPWIMVPFGDKRINLTCEKFNVQSIPTVIILTRGGTVIEKNGVEVIEQKGDNAINIWLR